jgi:hypothetical protein
MSWSGHQKKKMFHNVGGQDFVEISAQAGVDNDLDGRGLALADFDNDGRLDMFQTNADQMSLLYHGATEGSGNWVQFQLTGTKSNRDAIGARIRIQADGLTQIREIDGGNGYAGQSTKRAHFGIGNSSSVDDVEIRWPSGGVEKLGPLPANKLHKVTEGQGYGNTTKAKG